jgi:decaprenyl-phosphate phosphoribosyltransferase
VANLPTEIIKVARPIHWVKNLALFAALIFTGHLFESGYFLRVFWGFLVFGLATSCTYIINDIFDAKADRLHPTKRFRPIASGKLPVTIALAAAVALGISALYLASSLNQLYPNHL